ncbi:MAG: IS30 family transposase [Propionibacteriaceae bacterium]|nr:IS30 family transposase [Propionibacteriaceae bacterium]
MGLCYRHLTKDERIVIRTLLQEQRSLRYIAESLGRSASTICREIKHNSGLRGYRPKQAQAKADERRDKPRFRKMTEPVIAHIETKLAEDHSPEQISGRMQREIGVAICTSRIYQHVWQDKKSGGCLFKHLRIANGKKRRRRHGKSTGQSRIPNRIGIEHRPSIVEQNARLGDWEADLVSGSRHRGYLVTLVERSTKRTRIGHVLHKTATLVSAETIRLLSDQPGPVHTITYDNGSEFAAHEKVNEVLGCSSYFAHAHHSWERGLNENTNGLIRQYFPKKMDLRDVSRDEIAFVEERLGNRPRKTLDFMTPEEVTLQML